VFHVFRGVVTAGAFSRCRVSCFGCLGLGSVSGRWRSSLSRAKLREGPVSSARPVDPTFVIGSRDRRRSFGYFCGVYRPGSKEITDTIPGSHTLQRIDGV